MPNFNPNANQITHPLLATESPKPQPSSSLETSPAVVQADSLQTGEQIQMTAYTVKRGDTLWDIADVKLGDPKKWPLLFALNAHQIKNPDLIYPGQVLTVPQQVEIAPSAPSPMLPSPVDSEPSGGETALMPTSNEAVDTTLEAEVSPVQETPSADASEENAVLLKPPSELPEPAPEAPSTAPTAESPESETFTPAPVIDNPTDLPPAAHPLESVSPPQGVIGQTPTAQYQSSGVGKAALIGGAVGTVTTGAVLVGITRSLAPPAANLGGYATAQVVAKGINSVIGKVGLKLPTGPALTRIVSKVGGPKVAGTVTALAAGAVVAGVAAGGYYLYHKATTKSTPQVPPDTNSNPQQSTAVSATPTTPTDTVHGERLKQLEQSLSQKTYFGLGKPVKPEAVSQLSEQIWLDATEISQRLDLAKTLVKHGQAQELARILGNMGVSDLEVAQLMVQPSFPTREFMAGIDDHKATLILISLSNVSTTGEPETARLLKDIASQFDGRFNDRKTPFARLKAHHEGQGTWDLVPPDVRSAVDALLK